MRKATALVMAAALGFGSLAVLQAPAQAQKRYEERVKQEQRRKNPGEYSVTCRGDARRGEVTKGALYGAGAGALLGGAVGLGTVGGAVVGAGAGAAIQNSQNNAACGR
jgi:hypothetical protein